MNIKKAIIWLFQPIINLFKKWQRLRTFAKANKGLQEAFLDQLKERKVLNKKIHRFLREYFKLDAKSDYIPPDFKNNEEVRIAIEAKFENDMKRLNITFEDIFPR